MKALALVTAALALSTAAGCVGANTSVVAPDSHYPVSLSRGVRDRDGSLVPEARRKVVGAFTDERMAWSMFYKLARLTPKTDLSQSIDQQVKAAGGDAIVNLRVGTLHCELNFMPLLTVLPIWPGCAKVFVRGDIVKVLPAPAIEGARAAAATPTPTVTTPQVESAPKAPAASATGRTTAAPSTTGRATAAPSTTARATTAAPSTTGRATTSAASADGRATTSAPVRAASPTKANEPKALPGGWL